MIDDYFPKMPIFKMPNAPAPVTHGVVHQTVTLDRLILTETRNFKLPRHSHAFPALTFIVEGGFTESFGSSRVYQCGELSLLFKPAGAEHSRPAFLRYFGLVQPAVARRRDHLRPGSGRK